MIFARTGAGQQPFFKVTFPTDFGDHVEEQEALTRFELFAIVKLILQGSDKAAAVSDAAPGSASSSADVELEIPAPPATGQLSMELLKPYKMAMVSPRVFWSMIYHFRYVDVRMRPLASYLVSYTHLSCLCRLDSRLCSPITTGAS